MHYTFHRRHLVIVGAVMALFVTKGVVIAEEPQTERPMTEEITVKAKKEAFQDSLEVREVRESFARDPGEALEKVDGVHKIRKGAIANDIDIRGFQKDNINVFIDGQHIHNACPNRMDPPGYHVDFMEIEKMEVIKGPYNVSQPGGMGGEVNIITRKIEQGQKNELNLGGGSYNTKEGSFRSSYGGEKVGFLVGGAGKTGQPFIDGRGKRMTQQYPDYDDPNAVLFSPYAAPEVTQAMSQMNQLKARYPVQFAQTFPTFPSSAPPSANQYKYGDRSDSAYQMKTGWFKAYAKPAENHRLEVSHTRQETENVMYPYLLMDAGFDNTSRTQASYTIEKLTSSMKELKFEAYTNSVTHWMTDEKRCSSTATVAGSPACTLPLTFPYSMATQADTRTTGGRIAASFDLLGTTTFGVDSYDRNWNATTTTRVKSFLDTSTPAVQQNYRDQASIPNVTTNNVGAYFENQAKLGSRLKFNTGLRHDRAISRAEKDRRSMYNLYYPGFEPLQYQSAYQMFTYAKYVNNPSGYTAAPGYVLPDMAFDAEIYLPQTKPTVVDELTAGNLRLTYAASDATEVFVGLGYGNRLPDPQERFFALQRMGTTAMPDYVGNPTLKPTKNSQGDLGLKVKTDSILVRINGFYSRLEDYIVTRFSGDLYAGNINGANNPLLYYYGTDGTNGIGTQVNQMLLAANKAQGLLPATATSARTGRTYRNVDAEIYGGEASIRVKLPSNFYAGTGVSYARGINTTEQVDLAEMPPIRGNAYVRWDNEKYFAEMEGAFAATQSHLDPLIGEIRTPGWGIGNLKAGAEFSGMKFVAGVRNVFDRFYYQHLSYSREPFASGVRIPEPGRNWYASLQWKF